MNIKTAFHLRDILLCQLINASSNVPFDSFAINSKQAKSGSLFVAIKTERRNGHDYLLEAKQNGATLALVSEPNDIMPSLLVEDTIVAMTTIARAIAEDHTGTKIAITGSAGKTTTREIIAKILSNLAPTYSTKENLNNHLGLPISISGLRDEKFSVFELGANAMGEISHLAAILAPSRSLITNISSSHIGKFGSLELIATAKSELIPHTQELIALNMDDKFFSFLKSKISSQHLITFSMQDTSADYTLVDYDEGITGTICKIKSREKTYTIFSNLIGLHQANNLLASLAVLDGLDIPETIYLNIQIPHRLSFHHLDKITLIDDSYNCSQASLKIAINMLANTAKDKQQESILIFGGMAELGDYSKPLNQEVSRLIEERKIDKVLAITEDAKPLLEDLNCDKIFFGSREDLADYLRRTSLVNASVLVKGSGSSNMGEFVELLRELYD